jgi:hypothetical protein
LTEHIAFRQPAHLSFPDHVHRLVPVNRVQTALNRTKLHAHLFLLAQLGRALVRVYHAAGDSPRLVPQRPGPGPQDRCLRTAVQPLAPLAVRGLQQRTPSWPRSLDFVHVFPGQDTRLGLITFPSRRPLKPKSIKAASEKYWKIESNGASAHP